MYRADESGRSIVWVSQPGAATANASSAARTLSPANSSRAGL